MEIVLQSQLMYHTKVVNKVHHQGEHFFSYLLHFTFFFYRFVHFTKQISQSSNVDFSPLYGSLRILENGQLLMWSIQSTYILTRSFFAGLYSLSYSLQSSQNGVSLLETGLYLYSQRSVPPQRQKVAGCTAKLGCGCSSTSLVSLNRGDVVRLEVDNGVVSSSDYNTFVMYLVEKGIN